MVILKTYEPVKDETKNKLVATHKYPTAEEAYNAAFALSHFPRNFYSVYKLDKNGNNVETTNRSLLFGYKVTVEK